MQEQFMIHCQAPVHLDVRLIPGKGRGVFAVHPIDEGVIIESCPLIMIPECQMADLMNTRLNEYCFQWGVDRSEGAIALGYGSLYNHSSEPNALYVRNHEQSLLLFISLKCIQENEEITVSYSGAIGDQSRVWFDVR